jgi:hypothetical protein
MELPQQVRSQVQLGNEENSKLFLAFRTSDKRDFLPLDSPFPIRLRSG